MLLKHRSGQRLIHRAAKQIRHNIRLMAASNQQQNLFSLYNILNTHRNRMSRHVAFIRKKPAIVDPGSLRKLNHMGAAGKTGLRLVKANMPVCTNTQQL